jgi:hypothetical protein
MSTDCEKVSRDIALENIENCCQTLCDKEMVVKYIKSLEYEIEWLKSVIKVATKS